jgi:hypothetical protein
MTFAKSLRGSLDSILADLSGEGITKSSHFEKVALFSKGIGKDRISDFTTNLIKNHLLEYSQEFALKHLYRGERATFEVPRAEFDFSRKRWVSKKYELPKHRGQYLLLTPMEILTGGDTWINRSDMVRKLWDLVPSVGNEELRARINEYIERELQGRFTRRQEQAVKLNAMAEFTEMYDYYIKAKEDNASEAFDESRRYVRQVQQMHIHQIRSIIADLESTTRFYTANPAGFETSRSRVLALKAYIEQGGGHHNFTNDGEPLNEPELGLITSILWSTINGSEKPYRLHWHEPDLVFKRGNNSRLADVLDKHLASLRDTPEPPKSLIVIVNYTQAEDAKTAKLIRDFEILGDPTVVTIDARGRLSNRPKPDTRG